MSCSDTIYKTNFQYNVVASYIERNNSFNLYARILAALYSQRHEAEAED